MDWRLAVLLMCTVIVTLSPGTLQSPCENGGIQDPVTFACKCTPNYYGRNCETPFTGSDLCRDPNIPEINDALGYHAPSNDNSCSLAGRCIDFSKIQIGWYRLKSPAGSALTSNCSQISGNCGSSHPYIVTNIIKEENNNIMLYSGKLSKVVRSGSVCYSTEEISYPVRILDCSSFNLYFLVPTSEHYQHYCIGNKKKCSAGLVSADGSGYEPCYNASACFPKLNSSAVSPNPVLTQLRIPKNDLYVNVIYNCSFQAVFESNTGKGLLYRVMYRLKYHNSTQIIIPGCTTKDLSVAPGSTATVSCSYENLLLPHSSIYGGALECIVQAKCNSDGADYISKELVSLPHRFEFKYKFVDNTTDLPIPALSPSNPIELCINISNVPTPSVHFRVTVRREAIISADKMQLMVSRPPGNQTGTSGTPCTTKPLIGTSLHYTTTCFTLQLMNQDEEGLIVYGLDGSQLVPVIEVNISYMSTSERGVYTAGRWEKVQSTQLKVKLELSGLYGEEKKDYFHMYSDPIIKPANSATTYVNIITKRDICRVLSVMRHKILPYEIQAKECESTARKFHSVVTEVAIRYESYIIRIDSKKAGAEYSMRYEARQISASALPHDENNVPRGVVIEQTKVGTRVNFVLYGTIIYVWGFITHAFSGDQCIHTFIQTRQSMRQNFCQFTHTVETNGFGALDVMIIPGFYDTASRVDGLMFNPIFDSPSNIITMNGERDMFSANFVPVPVLQSLIKPTSELDFCACTSDSSSYDASKMCIIEGIEKNRKLKKRSTVRNDDVMLSRPARSAWKPAQLNAGVTITEEMATRECANYVQTVQASKAQIVIECSTAKGILGSLDFIKQFKTVCIQYATQLNTFNFTESLFNSFAGRCIASLSYNVTTVKNRPQVLQQMIADFCPSNCNGRGTCINGLCYCRYGYFGTACERCTSLECGPVVHPGTEKPSPEKSQPEGAEVNRMSKFFYFVFILPLVSAKFVC